MPMHEVDDDRYEVIDGNLERDRETVIGLWRGSIGWQDQLERMYDVFYLRCPFGRPRLALLRHRHSGEIVGTIGIAPRPMLWRGSPITAAVGSHFTLRRGHHLLRPAMMLLNAMVKISTDSYPVSYAMTNAYGVLVGHRAGYREPAHLPRHVRVLRYRPFAALVLPVGLGQLAGGAVDGALAAGRRLAAPWRRTRLMGEWLADVDQRMQTLWERSPHGDVLMTVRSTRMLAWRFLELPSIDRRFLLVSPARGAALVAWFACETNVRASPYMTVTDAWFADGADGADREAIRVLCRMAYAAGYAAIETRVAAAPAVLAAWRAEGFATRGQQPFFMHGIDLRRPDGSLALHLTDIEQDG